MATQTTSLGPNQKLPLTHAATLLGVPVRSLRRIKAALVDGTPPNCRDPWLLAVAKLYAKAEQSATDVKVKSVFSTVGQPLPSGQQIPITPLVRPATPKKKVRARHSVVTASSLPVIREGERPTDEERAAVSKQFWDKVQDARNSAGQVPWKQIHDLAHWLIKAGQPPQGYLQGYSLANLDLSKIMRFGSVGDFLSRAALTDLWPFVFSEVESRPVDLFSATKLELRYGFIVLLTAEEWTNRMQKSIRLLKSIADAQGEGVEIGSQIRNPAKSPAQEDVKEKVRPDRATGL